MNRKDRRAAKKQSGGGLAHPMSPAVTRLFAEAVAFHRAGRPGDAIAAYERALALEPRHAMLHDNLGTELARLGRIDEAAAAFRRAIALNPNLAEAHANLGICLRSLGRRDEAVASYRRAIALKPNNAEAHNNLGNILKEAGDLPGAIAAFRRAVALKPDLSEAQSNLTYARMAACDWRDLDKDQDACRAFVRAGAGEIAPFAFLAMPSTASEQLACARLWARSRAQGAGRLPPTPPGERQTLRIGYLSGDFRLHPLGVLAAELFECHDRSRVAVTGYSYGPDDGSAMRRRLERGFDRFIDIRAMAHEEAARRIRADGIDILVDLTGHTENGRMAILAWRPAPIQVNYLGYAGSMGTEFVDYVIADATTVPMAEQEFFDERIVHLPHCYQPNDRQRAVAERTPSRAECGLPETGLVFCCFNNTYKIAPAFFDAWMRLLAATPDGVLWLLGANDAAEANLRREAKARGADPGRLVFAPRVAPDEHMARHALADLFLDTLPYNAHTTASDALWAGVPVVTCRGTTFAGRVATSLLRAMGLPELVTDSLAAYEALAARLAGDRAQITAVRAKLAANRRAAPLFDMPRFVADLEAAYRRMWEIAAAGQRPESFALPPQGA